MIEELDAIHEQGKEIKQVAFAPNGGWVILYGTNGYVVKGIP